MVMRKPIQRIGGIFITRTLSPLIITIFHHPFGAAHDEIILDQV
jgi:hypothetical protein